MKKPQFGAVTGLAWVLVGIFAYLALTVESDRWSNIWSDAFGTSFAIVILGTLTWITLKIKKVI